jgi:hypothetical protein
MGNIVDRMAQSVKGHGAMIVRRLSRDAVNKQLKKTPIQGGGGVSHPSKIADF